MHVKTPDVDMLVGREHLKQKKGRWPDLLVEREQGKIKKAHAPEGIITLGRMLFPDHIFDHNSDHNSGFHRFTPVYQKPEKPCNYGVFDDLHSPRFLHCL